MSQSILSRSLAPLAAALWGIFIAWTILLGAVWIVGVDAVWLETSVANTDLRMAAAALVQSVVPAWLALAVVNMHLTLTREEGLQTARRWLFLTMAAALVLGVGARTAGIPFGPFDFKDSLGPRLAGVPVGWPLVWFVLAAGARELVLWVQPRLSHGVTTIAGAMLSMLTLANLHPLVMQGREGFRFWFFGSIEAPAAMPWYAPLPVLAFAWMLGWLMRQMRLLGGTHHRSRRPAMIFLLLNLLLLAANMRRWLA